MAYRREIGNQRHDVRGYRSGNRTPGGSFSTSEDESGRLQPRRWQRGFGWARQRDIADTRSQSQAPRFGGHYDRTGEEQYARGFEEYDERVEFEPGRGRRWELDEGGVQFGQPFGPSPSGRQAGPHRGRGPRGYQRSDERIREDVCEALTEAADVDASEIDVSVASGTVTLSGSVDSRRAKRRSEDIAAEIGGVHDVQNQLRVNAGDDRGRSAS